MGLLARVACLILLAAIAFTLDRIGIRVFFFIVLLLRQRLFNYLWGTMSLPCGKSISCMCTSGTRSICFNALLIGIAVFNAVWQLSLNYEKPCSRGVVVGENQQWLARLHLEQTAR